MWSQLLQILVSSSLLGSLYGIVALGLSLAWTLMDILDLSHGIRILLGGFLAYSLIEIIGIHPLLGMAIGALALMMLSVAIHVTAIQKIAKFPLVTLTFTLGLAYLIEGLGSLIWPPGTRTVRASLTGYELPPSFTIAGISISTPMLEVAIVSCVLLIFTHILIRKCRFGRTLRALIEDSEQASVMGVNVFRVVLLAIIYVALVNAVGGVLYLKAFGAPLGGWVSVLMKAFSLAVFIGRPANFSALFIVGFFLALVENVIGLLMMAALSELAAVVLVILILVVKYREI